MTERTERLERATAAVRDEVGSMLCCWIEGMRMCRKKMCLRCLCQDVAEAVLEADGVSANPKED